MAGGSGCEKADEGVRSPVSGIILDAFKSLKRRDWRLRLSWRPAWFTQASGTFQGPWDGIGRTQGIM